MAYLIAQFHPNTFCSRLLSDCVSPLQPQHASNISHQRLPQVNKNLSIKYECDDDGCGDVRHLSRMSWECSRPSLLWNPTLTGLWLRGCFKSEIREWIWVFELENFNCIPWCHLCPKRNYSSKEGASWCPCLEPGVLFLFLPGHLENFGQVEAFQRQGFTTKPVWLKIFEVQIYHNPHPLNKSSDSHHLSLQDYYWTNPGNEGMEKKAGKNHNQGHELLPPFPESCPKCCNQSVWPGVMRAELPGVMWICKSAALRQETSQPGEAAVNKESLENKNEFPPGREGPRTFSAIPFSVV